MPKFGDNSRSRLHCIRKMQLEGRTYAEAVALWREAQEIVNAVGDVDLMDISQAEVREIVADWRRVADLVGDADGTEAGETL